MKKNLNIAYLNGAEGMIRRGGASSGGSGSGESDAIVIDKVYEIAAYTTDWSQSLSRCAISKVFDIISTDNVYTNYGVLDNTGVGSSRTAYATWYMAMDKNYALLDSYFVNTLNVEMGINISKEEMFNMIDSEDISMTESLIDMILASYAQNSCLCYRFAYDYSTTSIISSMYEHFDSQFILLTNNFLFDMINIKIDGSKIGLNDLSQQCTAIDAIEFPTITTDNTLINVFKDWIIDRFPNNGQSIVDALIGHI